MGTPQPSVASGATPEYGIDAPGVVLTFVALAVVCAFLMAFAAGGNAPSLAVFFLIAFLINAATVGAMVHSSKRGKQALWQRTLDRLELRGDEHALDVGCGRGMVLIETAQRLPEGRAVGIDIWRSKDQSGNAHVVTDANVAAAGLRERIEIRDGDMRDLPFEDGSFDLVTASLAIHNIRDRGGRDEAIREISRVLKPGGRVVIIDIAKIKEYREVLVASGVDVDLSGTSVSIYPPVKTLLGRKA